MKKGVVIAAPDDPAVFKGLEDGGDTGIGCDRNSGGGSVGIKGGAGNGLNRAAAFILNHDFVAVGMTVVVTRQQCIMNRFVGNVVTCSPR